MLHHRMTRRDALKASALLVPALTTTVSASAAPKPALPDTLTLGMATTDFRELTNRQLADELAAAGLRVVQLFLTQSDSRYWKYNNRSDLADLTPARGEAIARTYRSAGLTLHSLGVYANMIHPDPTERDANLAYFEAMMRVGRDMGVDTFITEAGHHHPEGPAPRVEYHFQEPVWHAMVATGKRLAEMAERHKVTVLFEPFFRGFLASAKRTRLFLEAVGSPRIRALLDPANLLEVDDLEEMFHQLKPWIGCLHAKDRKLHVDAGVAAGKGDLDYAAFVRLAAQHTPSAPLVLEYVGSKDYRDALQHLRQTLRQAGLHYR
ncbi:MAG: sugar phosphate isomerase/epimerase [Verrucomicrobia bacterium]|nr:sugar phosphate isomerase/epimerase [Verrucomicrobiota bacterium]